MKAQLSLNQAIKELQTLIELNDGKVYCMTYDRWTQGRNKWRVGEKISEQKQIDASNPELANTKVIEYNVTNDLH